MIGNLVDKEYLASASDEKFEIVLSNHALRVMGVIDVRVKIIPDMRSLDSYSDEDASEWAFNATNLEASLEPWSSINDSSLAVFDYFMKV